MSVAVAVYAVVITRVVGLMRVNRENDSLSKRSAFRSASARTAGLNQVKEQVEIP